MYESERAHPLPKGLATDAAREFIERHPVGARITTHVPAGDPANAYLVPVRQWTFPAAVLFGLLFTVPAVGLAWLLTRRAVRSNGTDLGDGP